MKTILKAYTTIVNDIFVLVLSRCSYNVAIGLLAPIESHAGAPFQVNKSKKKKVL